MCIFKLSAIITFDMLDSHIIFILNFLGKSLENFMSPGLYFLRPIIGSKNILHYETEEVINKMKCV